MKIRRTALDRAVMDMQEELSDHGFTVDIEARTLTTPMGTYSFSRYMTRTECRAAIRRYCRMDAMSKQIVHDIKAERDQGKLL